MRCARVKIIAAYDSMGWIYMITNKINGKAYIGQTQSSNVNRRWSAIKRAPHGLLKKAFNRWKIENFTFETIYEIPECEGWLKALDDREILEIRERKTLSPNGYNLESGGKREKIVHEETKKNRSGVKNSFYGKTHTAEAIEKIRIANTGSNNHRSGKPSIMIGKQHVKETLQKMSESQSGEKNGFFGKHHSDETKVNLSIQHSKMTGSKSSRAKKVEQLIDGKWIIFCTAREAGAAVGTDARNIGACCRGEQRTAGGFSWRFAS